MKVIWRFLGQAPRLEPLERFPPSPGVADGPGPGDRRDRHERVVARERPGPPEAGGPFRRLAEAVFAYDIYPQWMVRGVLRRPVRPGDTYGICYRLLPGVELFFGGRVTTVFDGPDGAGWRAGWTFHTLTGHPELGEETFSVEKDAEGVVRVTLRAWSRPGLWLTRAVAPYTRRVQLRAARAALDHLEGIAAGELAASAHGAS
jgi:uncharacterized protein (UPF0548 family)